VRKTKKEMAGGTSIEKAVASAIAANLFSTDVKERGVCGSLATAKF